ncbi:uncharacterized sulfatase [Rubritalea squalenifaciens DSM 18772]|uniref:Uncharacterized sulfatase n=1 Tax=Rubritalea squalenifaciens DSM 18772 TaxID=1123071 RepID=A0A1M6LZS3_9BACT|nr:sulfatase [Rubritalea squalenifaciens]SHJ76523.1 uncharacterized sulfatase [Rubritalea squalenifaciens DSM 18772]
MKRKLFHLIFSLILTAVTHAQEKPNILWLTAEDHGPHLGCYGDTYATTPHIDALAKKSLLYTVASSNAPVCAPARTTIITGMYPTSLGAEYMRSKAAIPTSLQLFPSYLKEAGYYCTNNSKEDYNLYQPNKPWNDSSAKAHWKNRKPGQPFFAVFNTTVSHESQIRNANKNPHHDSAGAPIPPYHPDTPKSRKDWAQYYDRLTLVDQFVQKHLDELEKAGEAENTIVFFYADHGSGMPRSKRYPGWSGLHVPMIVHIPKKWENLANGIYQRGGTSDRPVSFVDLAPTVLTLAGLPAQETMPGHSFFTKTFPNHSMGFKARMDEKYDLCRSIRKGKYVYIRNFMPHLPHGQELEFQLKTNTTRIWRELFLAGKLNATQAAFWQPHPAEELFNLEADPHETVNLASNKKYQKVIEEMRGHLMKHMLDTRDLGFMPESYLLDLVEGENTNGYDIALSPTKYPLSELVKMVDPAYLPEGVHPLIQYWQMQQVLTYGQGSYLQNKAHIADATQSANMTVRLRALDIMTRHDTTARGKALQQVVDIAMAPEINAATQLVALNILANARAAGYALPSLEGLKAKKSPHLSDSYSKRILNSLMKN